MRGREGWWELGDLLLSPIFLPYWPHLALSSVSWSLQQGPYGHKKLGRGCKLEEGTFQVLS